MGRGRKGKEVEEKGTNAEPSFPGVSKSTQTDVYTQLSQQKQFNNHGTEITSECI